MRKRSTKGADFLVFVSRLFPCKSSFTCLVKGGLPFLKSDLFFEVRGRTVVVAEGFDWGENEGKEGRFFLCISFQ